MINHYFELNLCHRHRLGKCRKLDEKPMDGGQHSVFVFGSELCHWWLRKTQQPSLEIVVGLAGLGYADDGDFVAAVVGWMLGQFQCWGTAIRFIIIFIIKNVSILKKSLFYISL
jgi:hypothetical protein